MNRMQRLERVEKTLNEEKRRKDVGDHTIGPGVRRILKMLGVSVGETEAKCRQGERENSRGESELSPDVRRVLEELGIAPDGRKKKIFRHQWMKEENENERHRKAVTAS